MHVRFSCIVLAAIVATRAPADVPQDVSRSHASFGPLKQILVDGYSKW